VKYISAGTSNQQNDKMPLDKQMTRMGRLVRAGEKSQGRAQDELNYFKGSYFFCLICRKSFGNIHSYLFSL